MLAVLAVGMHFVRIFDRAFWYDEALPLYVLPMNFRDMLRQVAHWGHTPLHYLLIWGLYRVFGDHGAMYHLVSLIPYAVTVAVTVTVVRKWFGRRTAALLLLFSALSDNAIRYNVEVRMYSWCQMFLFLAFLMLYRVLKTGKTRCFVWMALCSLGAVYSHSFAVAAVGMFYLFSLVYFLVKNRKAAVQTLVSGVSVVLLFLPWLLYSRKMRGQLVARYLLGDTGWRDCLAYVFSSRFSVLFLGIFAVLFLSGLLFGTGVLRFQPGDSGKKRLVLSLSVRTWRLPFEWVWMATGAAATFMTVAAAEWFSHRYYPIITLRYLYPAFITVWLVFCVCVSKCGAKKLLSLVLAALLLVSGVPSYLDTVKSEREIERTMRATLAATGEIADTGGHILTDIESVDWPLAAYYYPKASHVYLRGAALPELRADETNWLILGGALSREMADSAAEQGYRAEPVFQNGYVGTYPAWVYRLVRQTQAE